MAIKRLFSRSILSLIALSALFSGCRGEAPQSQVKEISAIDHTLGEPNYFNYFVQLFGGPFNLDPALYQYVNRIAARVVSSTSYRDRKFSIEIVNYAYPFAISFPNGKIAFSRGLFSIIENEAELAGILTQHIIGSAKLSSCPNALKREIIGAFPTAPPFEVIPFVEAQNMQPEQTLLIDSEATTILKSLGYDPRALSNLYEKFDQLGFASYFPFLNERIESLTKKIHDADYRGYLGSEGYIEIVMPLHLSMPAYDLFIESLSHYAQDNLSSALHLIEKAISIEENEAIFHILKGRCYKRMKKPKDALASFSKAVELNSHYYYPYFERAKLLQSMNRNDRAVRDFEAAGELLPSPSIMFLFGNLLMAEKEVGKARSLYEHASLFNCKSGEKARKKLSKLKKL